MFKKRGLVCLVSIFALIFSVSLVSAQTEGIPLQKDVILGVPIYGPEDLPEEITFTLYDAQNGLTPLGTQTFPRGQYTVDFEFSQSDGVTGGSVARVKADFTQPLNLKDASGQTLKPKELWAALEVAGAEVGARTRVSDETLVRLLLNSNASMATYLTLAYEGDDNPLTTIYKSLPLSFSSSDGTTTSLSNYFSSLPESRTFGDTTRWNDSGASDVYIMGKVGIGKAPSYPIDIQRTTAGTVFGIRDATAYAMSMSVNNLGSGTLYLKNAGSTSIALNGGGDSYFVNTGGNLGIGTTEPGYPLHIKRSAAGTAFAVQDNTTYAMSMSVNNLGSGTLYLKNAGSNSIVLNGGGDSYFNTGGGVGIGTTNPGSYTLAVEGKIGCRELVVTTAAWADFVFEDNYRLPTLREVERHIQERGHLPGIPTEAQVKEQGVSVGEISSKLLQKIEELTLYVININKENESLKAQLANLETQLKEIKN